MTLGWIDASGGVSGDMLLGALLDAGVQLAVIQDALDALALPEPITVTAEPVRRGGLAATHAVVSVAPSTVRRSVADVIAVLGPLPDPLRSAATSVFAALGAAEAAVHGRPVDEIHLHEVGALDSIADVVGVVAGLHALGLDRLVCSPIAVGGGRVGTEHGPIPVPGPAVVELLRRRGAPAFGGPVERELATPTGVALLTVLADEFGSLPAIVATRVGIGGGTNDIVGHANVTRLVVGPAGRDLPAARAIVLEANVDDLDPQLWPAVLGDLLAAGAFDAWLTPILMKKGRPAHTLSVLAEPARADALARLVFTHTSTIGLRRRTVDKIALAREELVLPVGDAPVRFKLARLDGAVVNVEPEYEDVARVATELGVPVKDIMDAARATGVRYRAQPTGSHA